MTPSPGATSSIPTRAAAWRPIARIAWRNVRKHWRHSLGSLLSIVVGFLAIGMFEGYLGDLEDLQANWYVQRSMMGHVIVEEAGASRSSRESAFEHAMHEGSQRFTDEFIAAHPDVVRARARVLTLSGLASTGKTGVMFVGWGYDVEGAAAVRGAWAWNTTAGVPLQEAQADSVIVGNGLAGLLDCTGPPAAAAVGADGTPIRADRPFSCRNTRLQLTASTETGQLNVVEPTIVGFFDAGLKELDAKFVSVPLPIAQRLLDTSAVSFYSIALRDEGEAARFTAAFNEAATAAGATVTASPWREHRFAELYRRTTQVLGLYRTFVVLIVVTIAGMSVFSTMLKAVNERVREIGTLRSIGYRRPHIVRLFTLEAVMLALVACAVGLVALVVVTALINNAGVTYRGGISATPIPLTVSLRLQACVFATLFLSGIAVFASWFPARRAARLSITDALGHAA